MKKNIFRILSLMMSLTMLITVMAMGVYAEPLTQFTNIPTIYLTLDGDKTVNDITKEDKLPGTFSMRADGFDDITDAVMTIKGRGNSTWQLPKKPYQINLSTKTNLLGMGASKKWILLANYWDKTLMRNAITYDLANKINNIFCVECEFVDLFINGEYRGNYLLCEKIEFGGSRIDEDTADGAVLMELEQQYRHITEGCRACIRTSSMTHVTLKEPEVEVDFSQEQLNVVKNYAKTKLNAVEAAIPQGYSVYSKLIDVQSFIDWYIENELAKNYDAAFVTSSYCYLDKSGVLHMGPVWDVDVCFGNQDVVYPDTIDNGLNTYNYRADKGAWYVALFKDATFVSMLKERWAQIKVQGHISGMLDKIDELSVYLSESQKHETDKWPDAMQVTDVRDNANIAGPSSAPSYFDFESEVKYLKDWLTRRIEWLDSQWSYDYCDLSAENLISSVDASQIKANNLGNLSSNNWVWNYTTTTGANSVLSTSKPFFADEIEDGQYVCSVNYSTYPNQNANVFDYMMLRLVGTDATGKETDLLCTPATHVTSATCNKGANGMSKLNLKFDTSEYNYKKYHLELDAYNATVSLNSVELYSVNDSDNITGDINCDGYVTSIDALMALQYSVNKITLDEKALSCADVDCSNDISSADALLILQYSVGKIGQFAPTAIAGKTITIATPYLNKYTSNTTSALLYYKKIQEISDKYNVKIDVVEADLGIIKQDIISGSNQFDIVEADLVNARNMVKTLDFHHLNQSSYYNKYLFKSAMTESLTLGGTTYGVATKAMSTNAHGLMMNKKLLQQYAPESFAKLSTQFENKSWNWDALTALLTEYKANAPSGSICMLSNTNIIGEAIVANAGYEVDFLPDNSGAKSSICSPEGIAALTYVRNLREKGLWNYNADVNLNLQYFSLGAAPIYAYHLDEIQNTDIDFEMTCMPFPIGPAQEDYVMSSFKGNAYLVPKGDEDTSNIEMLILAELASIDNDLENAIVTEAASWGYDKLGQKVFCWAANNTTRDFSGGAFTAAVGTPVDNSVLGSGDYPETVIPTITNKVQKEVDDYYGQFYIK